MSRAKTILGLDLAERTGWAIRGPEPGAMRCGVWHLDQPEEHRRLGTLWELLGASYAATPFDFLAYEDPFVGYNFQTALRLGGYRGAVLAWAGVHRIPVLGVAPRLLKRFATGKGNANKATMMLWARQKWPEVQFATDDEADAMWVAEYAAAHQRADALVEAGAR